MQARRRRSAASAVPRHRVEAATPSRTPTGQQQRARRRPCRASGTRGARPASGQAHAESLRPASPRPHDRRRLAPRAAPATPRPRQPRAARPRRGRSRRCSRRSRRRTSAAATVTVRQGVTAGRPVRGSTMWWSGDAAGHQRRTVVPEVARPPLVDRDRRAGLVEARGVVVRDPHRPAVLGRSAGDGDVATEADEHAGPRGTRPRRRRCGRPRAPWRSRRGRARRRARARSVHRRRSTRIPRRPGTGAKRARNERAVAQLARSRSCGRSRPDAERGRRSGRRGRRWTRPRRARPRPPRAAARPPAPGPCPPTRSGARARSRRGSGCTPGRSPPARARAPRVRREDRPHPRRTATLSSRAPETRPTPARRSRGAGGGDRGDARRDGRRRRSRSRSGSGSRRRRGSRCRALGLYRRDVPDRLAPGRVLHHPALRRRRGDGARLVAGTGVGGNAGKGTCERSRPEDREACRAPQPGQAGVPSPRTWVRTEVLHDRQPGAGR